MSIANTDNKTIIEAGIIDDNDQVLARVEHLKELEKLVGNLYPNKYERSRITGDEDTITNLLNFKPVRQVVKQLRDNTPEGEKPNPELKDALNAELRDFGTVRVSGRLAVPPRVMGKAAFVHLSDGKERLQIYVRKQDAKVISNDSLQPIDDENAAWEVFKLLDHGDFVGASGYLFLTNTGELSVHVETFQFLSKALLPMPDKMHGIADPELRRRYRYADLIASSLQVEHEGLTTREVFERRAKLISGMRAFLEAHGYIEVETPMLTPKATGAAAEPFATHHNALDIPLYARIAPELYLKRLTVGGFEKVYELNRNFRNEGLSHKHNPEFTMLEFYCAYMDVNGMMDFAEAMIKESVQKAMIEESVQKATGDILQVKFDGQTIDFSKFERISMKEAISNYWASDEKREDWMPMSRGVIAKEKLSSDWFDDKLRVIFLHWLLLPLAPPWERDPYYNNERSLADFEVEQKDFIDNFEYSEVQKAQLIVSLFEKIENKLIQPTFIIDYPKSISPLSKASPQNPQIAERFELFINGMEVANGFSELNDPQEQFERFMDQAKERESGDAEAMVLDEDYIRALAYGMPPAAGIGIGIDRLVMLLTNRHSIRDVILFPHMRPASKEEEKRSEGEEETGN